MRKIGFDIGISSIGWAVVDTGESDDKFDIIDCGVRIFEAGEARNSTGKIIPSALPRREARSARRRLARRKTRLNSIKRLLCKEFGFHINDFKMQGENLPKIFETSKETKSPWYLRKEALERKLTQSELARVILHIAKHRGYDDLRYPIVTKDESEKSKEKDSQIEQDAKKIEDEKAKYSITNNLKESKKYQSGVLMLFEKNSDEKGELKDNAIFRNKAEKINKLKEKIENTLKRIVKDNNQSNKTIKLENLKSEDNKALNVKELISKIYEEAKTKGKYSYKDLRDTLLKDEIFKSALNLDDNFKISVSKKDEFIDFEKDNKTEKQGIYTNSIPQSVNQEELNLILRKQKEFGYKFSDKFEKDLIEKVFYSKPLQSFENKVGNCSFIQGEKRAPKFSPLAQEFIAVGKIINTLLNIYKDTGEDLQEEKIIEILNLAKSKGEFKYKDLAKVLNLENYQIKGSKKEDLSDKFIDFSKYNKFTKICKSKFGDEFCDIYNDNFNEIAKICSYNKDKISLEKAFKEKGYEFNTDEIAKLLDLGFKDHVELSEKALKQILPLMMSGKRYDEACKILKPKEDKEQNEEQNKTKFKLLPPLCKTHFANELTNPVVNRAISQYRKVLNAIILKYGSPDEIHFELAREAMKNAKDRKEIENAQNENFAKNERAKKFCEEIGLKINEANILKVKLWQEQNEFSPYTLKGSEYKDGKITIKHLLSENMLEIDHILPLSRSFDDSQSNKVLVFRSENQDKGALTPFEKWGNTEQWQDMKTRFESLLKNNRAKLKKLLNTNFKDRDEKDFGSRALNDTAYLSKLIKDYTSECLALPEPIGGKKQQIFAINGIFTTILRYKYGLAKKNRENNLHHAQDAIIIAVSDMKMVKALSEYMRDLEQNKRREFQSDSTKQFSQSVALDLQNADFKTKRKFKHLPEFRSKVSEAVSKIFVSKPPRKKVTGELHKAKIYLKNDPKFSDRKLHEIRNGLAENGEMPRVDIFTKKGKFYAVPIYTMDFAKGELPNITAGSTNHKIDDSFEFKFSLFKSDLIRIKKKGMKEPVCCYFASIHSGTSAITIEKQNNDYANLTDDEKLLFMDKKQAKLQPSVGIQNLEVFEKIRVSPLGELYCLLSDNPNIKHEPEKLLTQKERAKIKQEKSQKD